MHKIYFPIFGSGLGHITRIYDVASYIHEADDQFVYSTFDEAFKFLKARGERAFYSPSIDLEWNEAGGFSSKDSILRFPMMINAFFKQI